jgi:hypothetical protein
LRLLGRNSIKNEGAGATFSRSFLSRHVVPAPGEFSLAGVVSSTLTGNLSDAPRLKGNDLEEAEMDGIVYLVGLIVIIMFILSLFGLR